MADGQDRRNLFGGLGLQQQRAFAVGAAAPFFQIGLDFVRVFAEAVRPQPPSSTARISRSLSLHQSRLAAARRKRSLIASPRPVSGIGITAMRLDWLVQFAQHRKKIGGRFFQIARGAEIELRACTSGPKPSSASSCSAFDAFKRKPRRRAHSGFPAALAIGWPVRLSPTGR